MGPPTAHPDHQRSLNAYARTPCSATQEAMRPDALSQDSPRRPQFRPAPDDFSEFSNRSSTIRSAHLAINSPGHLAADSWSPVLYDPTSDSVRIIPPSRKTPLVSQFREFKDKINGVKHGVHAHRLAGILSHERLDSQALPLRAHEAAQDRDSSASEIHHFVQPSSARLGRADWKEFDLMAPPPGRKRSSRTTQDDSATRPQSMEGEDANPSKTLTSQIASSVMQERSHIRGAHSFPPPVPQKDQPQRAKPSHRAAKSHPSTRDLRSASRRSAQKTRSVPPSRRPSEDDDDPFAYDKIAQDVIARRASPSTYLSMGKGAGVDLSPREFPCPFRRRNPVMFNIRDHEQCAQRPFSDISELRRHIRTHHRRRRASHHCPRCKKAFGSENALGDHLTVPVEEMCEPRSTTSEYLVEDGISEATEGVLCDGPASIRTWEEIWWLLFPQDAAVLDPEFNPVIEAIEAEQEFDDSSAELKADLCDALKRILPEQANNGPLFQVLAGQLQLVLEQHRAKVLRRCRHNASTSDNKEASSTAKPKTTRFSVATTAHSGNQGHSRRPSLHPERTRRSQVQPPVARTSISPASSVYSQASGSHYSLGVTTRTNSLSSAAGGALYVESPRLPFRDWVHGIKFNNNNNNHSSPAMAPEAERSPPLTGQRDSGLALQCEKCCYEECQCGSYADQLSAFLTPVVGAVTDVVVSRAVEESDDGEEDWEALYGGRLGPATGADLDRDGRGRGMLSARSLGRQAPQGEFI